MSPLIWLVWSNAAVLCLLPVNWAWRFVIYYWRRVGHRPPQSAIRPLAAVILPVRGADPALPRCVRCLLRQNYPRYQVHIVVDHEDDPAWNVVHSVLAEQGDLRADVRVSVLRKPLDTCSLKVSAQLQAISELSDDVEVVAFIDADSIPAPDWLESLARPLADPKVGTTTGLRWFAPSDSSWGSMVRHMYNAGSQPQMFVFQIPWGGSMAMLRETMVRAQLPEHWSRCFCEDTSSYGPLDKLGYRNEWIPAATQFNEESLELPGAARFIFRQLLCVRLHTARWPAILIQNLANAVALTASMAVAIIAAGFGNWQVCLAFGSLVAAYGVGMVGLLFFAERTFRANMRERLGHVPPYAPVWKLVPAIAIAQSLSMRYLWKCIWARQIDWRGVTYSIDREAGLRLEQYRPYLPMPSQAASRSVL